MHWAGHNKNNFVYSVDRKARKAKSVSEMKKLPIKGWQWRERLKQTHVKQRIQLQSEAEKHAFYRAADKLGYSVGTLRSVVHNGYFGWIINKKGKGK